MSLHKHILPLSLLLLGLVWFACVDPPTNAPPLPEPPHTLARFAHVALDAPGAQEIKVDGASKGTIAFGQTTDYLDFGYGNRQVTAGAISGIVNFLAEQQATVLVYSAAGTSHYLYLLEADRNHSNAIDTLARVQFVHAALGSAGTITFRSDSSTGADLSTGVAIATAPNYTNMNPGTITIFALSGGGYLSDTLSGAQEVPPVSAASNGTGKVEMTGDGGLTYTVTVQCTNSEGFFTGGDISHAAAGSNGPVVATLDVSTQTMSFPAATVDGAAEVPPVTTLSSGTADFALSKSGGLTYTVKIRADNSQGFYTGAGFYRAAAGATGPIVASIPVTSQSVPFAAASLTGLQEDPPVSTNAAGTGTFTLYPDSLVYSITVTTDILDSVFTGAGFFNAAAGATGPLVKSIAEADSFTSVTLAGKWTKSDSVTPLTDPLITELLAGRIYVNFLTPNHPGGLIRGQLMADSVTLQTFTGTWNDSTLSSGIMDDFGAGRIYVNFLTAANPTGQVRAQVTPDNITTNTFAGTLDSGTVAFDLRPEFNAGNMYFNLTTNANPGGHIRGQLSIDPAVGSYGVTSLAASAFDAGKLYTIVAVGNGTTLQLLKFSDRVATAAKVAAPVKVKNVSRTSQK